MAYEILTESYGRRLPKITATADSTDDLAALGTDYAEGSTCTISDKTYSLDKVQGWIEAGGGGGGGGGALVVHVDNETRALDKTWQEIDDAKPLAYIDFLDTYLPLRGCGFGDGVYYVEFLDYLNQSSPELYFETDSPDGYPVYFIGD